ncbi:MAG: hypothetical protein S4CHLAM123_01930 [Chlamydiales bacterium]|nr:hypothetical protein [Chlamydiales bacterium]
MLNTFAKQLSTDMGFEQELEAKDDGTYSLRIEPDIEISMIEHGEGGILFRTKVAELPQNNIEEYFLGVMTANLFGRETGGSALGLDSEGKKLVLQDFLSEQVTYSEFYERLEDFANYADIWRQRTMESSEE